jgi:hypothetical protein
MNGVIEQRIEALVTAVVMTSQALSNALFGPMGLYGKLAKNEQERRAISQTPLFQREQARISELRRFEHEEYIEELERKCKARSARAAANGPASPPNGAATEPSARADAAS